MSSTHEEIVRSGPAAINRWKAENAGLVLQAANVNFGGLDLSGADLSIGDFTCCLFRGGNLTGTKFHDACLKNADFSDCNLRGADLTGAKLTHATFRRASIDRCKLDRTIGLSRTRALENARLASGENVASMEDLRLPKIDRLIPWQKLRILGRLPLFVPSYVTAGLLFMYFSAVSYWNEWITRLYSALARAKVANELTQILAAILNQSAPLRPSMHSLLLLTATIALGTGSTLYLLYCPSRIQAFNIDEWEFAHGMPRIQYLASGWRFPTIRVTCALAYLLGGSVGLYLIGYNLVRYLCYVIEHLR